ncbi:phage tail sheath subtilisin-like domain-containing protein [Microcoleus sp. D3_18_C4]|uniref:phage tail sheath subtilisin-like domain-containing protein n=1 Tax=Microcoleus sp. D3_18_C4 TaxID=3055335 RepID=UPI002FD1E8F9
MATYLSPGVYVREVSSGSAPIAGAGTSTAAFIGVVPDTITIPTAPVISKEKEYPGEWKDASTKEFIWIDHPGVNLLGDCDVWVSDRKLKKDEEFKITDPDSSNPYAKITFTIEPRPDKFKIKYTVLGNQITNEVVSQVPEPIPDSMEFKLKQYPINTSPKTYTIKINGEEIKNVNMPTVDTNGVAKFTLKSDQMKDLGKKTITADYQVTFPIFHPVPSGEVKLCTNFKEFKNFFGDFSQNEDQKKLAHAVSGFFNNGGTRCYVMRVTDKGEITDTLLESLEAIDEIAMVTAPGITEKSVRSAIITHCEQKTGDRFAILDCGEGETSGQITKPDNSHYAAFYFPWIQIFDPATKTAHPDGDGLIYVPPSGHIAGIYARVDAQRGVHKAPANEVVLGGLGLKQNISKNQQGGLNPQGINCIRNLNGNIRVWGARTIGGDENGEFKYINVRRLFNYLKKSIDHGTQWTVFEPNSPELWAKIRRNVTSFLMTVWRSGALFGSTPEQAFYVKCDEETNPPELREQGQVITEIGVAIVKPAEFVIFNLSQWSGPGK